MIRWIGSKDLIWVGVLALLSNGVILWAPSRLMVFVAGFVLICLLPGFLLTRVLLCGCASLGWLEVVALTCGLGFAVLILGTLGLSYLPGPLMPIHFLVFYNVVILLLTATLSSRGSALPLAVSRRLRPRHLIFLVLILVAGFLRLANLSYSEFQGDEARAMLMAAGAIRGEEDILFQHRKGPAEILVPAAIYALHGTTDELVARLPFALANVAGLLSMYVLTCRLFPDRDLVPIVTMGLLTVDGYLVAFGRIVQYQSIVVLMMALTAWSALVWFRTGRPRLLVLAALFLAAGILAHYEAIFVIPLVVCLFVGRARREAWPVVRWLSRSAGPALVFLVVGALFYGPYVLHPHFKRTLQYLTEGRIGGSVLYNNLGDFFWRATFYSSTYYVALLILGVVAFVVWEVHRSSVRPFLGHAVSVILVIVLVIAGLFPRVLVLAGVDLAFLPLVALLGLVVALSPAKTEVKAVLLWFGLPSLFLFFMMRKPKNHGYLLVPAWATLASAAFGRVGEILKGHPRRFPGGGHFGRAALILGAFLMAMFGYYEYLVFIQHTPNFLRMYPQRLPPFYASIHGDQLPRVGFFGFPHRSGLKAVGALRAQGVLQGSYAADAEPLITSWYTRQLAWCPESADYYVISSPLQDSEPLPVERIREELDLLARVWSGGEAVSEIYSRQPVEVPVEYELSALEGPFDASTRVDTWLWALRSPVPGRQVDAQVGDLVQMQGYDALREVTAGDVFPLMLYWQSATPLDQHYNVFVHIEVEGERIWAQSDGTPGCGAEPTTDWEPGATVVDGHSLLLDPSTPPGDYPLLAGLYDPLTGERLPVTGRDANSSGNAVILGTVQVVAPYSTPGLKEDQL